MVDGAPPHSGQVTCLPVVSSGNAFVVPLFGQSGLVDFDQRPGRAPV